MPQDALGLLLPMFSGSKSDFGTEHVPGLPLSFDRVNEGRPPVSTAPLFKLPVEILNLVNLHVPASSLASFALVNSDCRQLARSRQFASVKFDYSDVSYFLLHLLTTEVKERVLSKGATRKPSLGVCIRRITVATDPQWVSHRHQISLTRAFADLDEDLRDKRIAAAGKEFFGTYLSCIQCLLRYSRRGLPHLELLDWGDKVVLSRSFFNEIASSSIKHLKLHRVAIDEEFEVDSDALSLRTLQLNIIWDFLSQKEGKTAPLCASILRLCAPTLESLTWNGMMRSKTNLQTFATDALELPAFPCLRFLRFGELDLQDSSVLDCLIHDGLVALEVDIANSPIHTTFFKKRGKIPSLETFVWDSYGREETQSLAFLRENPQLSRLSIEGLMPTALLENELLPLLSGSFQRLTSLSLAWESNYISAWALKNISSLKSLQQLHLCVGARYERRTYWAINHKSVRGYLRKLPLLRKIAFSCDSYKGPNLDSEVESYYEDRDWDLYDPDIINIITMDQAERDRRWEQMHSRRMVTEANKYARMMGNLEWIYVGQLPMRIEKDLKTKERIAIPLLEERLSCWTLLKEMFGWKEM
ncbi:hypothetical protein MMC30_009201 [Trapelia coarctata]|nr:hypothetical protein [Trapelia coarctata]